MISIAELMQDMMNGELMPTTIEFKGDIYEYSSIRTFPYRYHCDKYDEIDKYGRRYLFTRNQLYFDDKVTLIGNNFKDIETLNLEQDELVKNKDIRSIDYLFEGTLNELIKNQKYLKTQMDKLKKE